MRKYMSMAILCVAIFIFAQGCARRAAVQPLQTGPDQEKAASIMKVKIVNYSFSPKTLRIQEGTRVRWTNYDLKFHTVTSVEGLFDSGNLPHGGMFSYRFEKKGTYEYVCEFHPYMKGRIIVE